MTTIVGISGSLRTGSFNSALLRAAAAAMPQGVKLEIATIKGIALPAAMSEDHSEQAHELMQLRGAAFDKAYVDHEVAYHQAVLDAVDKTLIPNAKNAELKALLVKVRPAFVAHLEHAKHLQASLGGK